MNIYNNNKQDRYWLYIFLCCFLFIIDRVSKHIALLFNSTFINNSFRFICIPPMKNTHTCLGWFSLQNKYIFALFILLTLYMFYLLLNRLYKKYKMREHIFGECLIIMGGLSNLYDRLVYSYVVDFIFLKLPIINYLAIYNLADIFIIIGILYIMWEFLFYDNNT